MLEGFQAGLSWSTILKKRTAFRSAFDQFDPEKISQYGKKKIKTLVTNEAIIRNPLKIRAAIHNAQCLLKVREEFNSFDDYIWRFVDNSPIINAFKTIEDIPSYTSLSQFMSTDLKKRGFTFVGPTICYSFMQAVGMVNDHTMDCFRYTEVQTH
jgi:DNA-3-methyladenine glycosylase I